MSDDGPLSVWDLKQCKLQLTLHMSLAKGGAHYLYTCQQYPRLQRRKSADTGRGPFLMQWLVDGIAFANLEECCVALNRTREENEQMADENARAGAGMAKWKIADGITELERDQQERGRTYPQLIGRSALSEAEANMRNAALEGAIKFLKFCKDNEPALREFMRQAIAAKAAAKEGATT